MADGRRDPVSPALRRPFTEQAAFFRRKLARQLPTERWDDLVGAAHDTAFVVAGAQKADLLSDLAASVDRAIVEGKSLEAFRKDFDAAVERNGWHGWTGEGSKGGRAWRTRTIYRTNASVSYAAGRLAQLKAGNFAFWVYRHGGSSEPRPEHVSWDGVALPPDHPFWEKHYPPSEWGCSCYVVGTRSTQGIRRLNGDPDKALPPGWDTIDPATGAPPGVGRGWDYAPGATVDGAIRAAASKVGSWDHAVAKSFFADLPDAIRDALAQSYRRLPSVADDARRYARRILRATDGRIEPVRTLGPLTSRDIRKLGDLLGTALDGFDFTLDASAVGHVRHQHSDEAIERSRGQRAVVEEDYALLPGITDAPDHVERVENSPRGFPQVALFKTIGGERYVAVFETLGVKRKTLRLASFYIHAAKKR